ncbi:MAG: Aminodeoxychorismate lyase [Parcubacteria group bacterium GW2011_GWC1_39_29]|nr:MAG: Aminodeoxychorismate lyase [Parcubacteria group bacterium GW2011_GWC1_39_29]
MRIFLEEKLNKLPALIGPTRQQVIWLFSVVVILILGVIIYTISFTAPQDAADLEVFSVSDDSVTQIADHLEEKGIIKSSLAFRIVFGIKGNGSVESGAYRVSKAMNVWEISNILNNEPNLKWVTIPEGLRKEEIASILTSTFKWTDEEKQKWITAYTALKYDYIEGVYFPDTYLIPTNETPIQIADRLRAHFEEKFAPYAKDAIKQNIKWTTALTLASIVQREAAGKNDMPLIARVLWNRLLKGQKLEVDATVQYARGNTGNGWWAPIKPADKQINSPYNTYLNKGLPPHPISNPGLEAIAAVLNPVETKCLFYLHDSGGTIHCAETYEEHLQNIQRYLK